MEDVFIAGFCLYVTFPVVTASRRSVEFDVVSPFVNEFSC